MKTVLFELQNAKHFNMYIFHDKILDNIFF